MSTLTPIPLPQLPSSAIIALSSQILQLHSHTLRFSTIDETPLLLSVTPIISHSQTTYSLPHQKYPCIITPTNTQLSNTRIITHNTSIAHTFLHPHLLLHLHTQPRAFTVHSLKSCKQVYHSEIFTSGTPCTLLHDHTTNTLISTTREGSVYVFDVTPMKNGHAISQMMAEKEEEEGLYSYKLLKTIMLKDPGIVSLAEEGEDSRVETTQTILGAIATEGYLVIATASHVHTLDLSSFVQLDPIALPALIAECRCAPSEYGSRVLLCTAAMFTGDLKMYYIDPPILIEKKDIQCIELDVPFLQRATPRTTPEVKKKPIQQKVKGSGYGTVTTSKMFKAPVSKVIEKKAVNVKRVERGKFYDDLLGLSSTAVSTEIHKEAIYKMSFSGCGRYYAALSRSGAQLWSSKEESRHAPHVSRVSWANVTGNALLFSLNGVRIVDAKLNVIENAKNKPISLSKALSEISLGKEKILAGRQMSLPNIASPVKRQDLWQIGTFGQWMNDDRMVLLGSEDAIALYELSEKNTRRTQRVYASLASSRITALQAHSAILSKYAITAHRDCSIKITDLQSQTTTTFKDRSDYPAFDILMDPMSPTFATTSLKEGIRLWDPRISGSVNVFSDYQCARIPCHASFRPDSAACTYISTGTEANGWCTFDIRMKRAVEYYKDGWTNPVTSIAYHPVFPLVIASGMGGEIKTYSAKVKNG